MLQVSCGCTVKCVCCGGGVPAGSTVFGDLNEVWEGK